MADFFENLLREDPYEEERQVVLQRIMQEMEREPTPAPQFTKPNTGGLAQSMQRRQARGNVLQATGDRALMGLGKTMGRGKTPEEFQQGQAQQDQVRQYQQWQANQAENKDRLGTLNQTLTAMDNTGSGGKLPLGAMNKINMGKTALRGIKTALGTFKPEHQQVLHKYQGPMANLPGWLVRQGWEDVLTESGASQDSSLWWAELQRNVIAPLRHELFGATLTKNEQGAFDAILAITPSTKPEMVRRRLQNMHDSMLKGERERAASFTQNWGNVDAVRSAYGGLLDTDNTSPESKLDNLPDGWSAEDVKRGYKVVD
jgi:hypothetical protein